MKHVIVTISLSLLVIATLAQAPFKYDSLYKKIYAKELCTILQKHPDVVFIDVRTPGEFSDTSRFASLNLGHLKGAINLNIEDIKKDSSLVDKYKNKTVVLYCSHSQRSRKVSKLLAEKGFPSFYNLNGGMSSLNQLSETEFPCKKEWIVSGLHYKNASFLEAANLINKEKALLIIDVRPAVQFNSTDTILSANIGRIKGAVNIPYEEFAQRINELKKQKQKTVLIYSASGDGNSARAATELAENGFTHVYQLLGGINEFFASQENNSFMEEAAPYHILNTNRSLNLLKQTKNIVIYDVRKNDEYLNKLTGMTSYRNLGHIKNAIHVEESGFDQQQLPEDKKTDILLYGSDEVPFRLAMQLIRKGYKNVNVMESFYDFVWSGFNIESCRETKTFLIDHKGLY